MFPSYKHGVLIHNYHEDQHGKWNLQYQATKPELKTPFPVSRVAHDWKPYSKTGPNPKLPSKDVLKGYLFFGHAANSNNPIPEFKQAEYYNSNGYFYRKPTDFPDTEVPVVDSFLDDPDPAGATLRRAASTGKIGLKSGVDDPWETTSRAELYGNNMTIRRSPSVPSVVHRLDPMTDPRRFAHDADAGWRRIGLRKSLAKK